MATSAQAAPSAPAARPSGSSAIGGLAFGPRRLRRDEEVVEAPEKEVPLLRGPPVVAHLERLVVAGDGHDVEDRERLGDAHEELEADRREAVLLLEVVAHG